VAWNVYRYLDVGFRVSPVVHAFCVSWSMFVTVLMGRLLIVGFGDLGSRDWACAYEGARRIGGCIRERLRDELWKCM